MKPRGMQDHDLHCANNGILMCHWLERAGMIVGCAQKQKKRKQQCDAVAACMIRVCCGVSASRRNSAFRILSGEIGVPFGNFNSLFSKRNDIGPEVLHWYTRSCLLHCTRAIRMWRSINIDATHLNKISIWMSNQASIRLQNCKLKFMSWDIRGSCTVHAYTHYGECRCRERQSMTIYMELTGVMKYMCVRWRTVQSAIANDELVEKKVRQGKEQ